MRKIYHILIADDDAEVFKPFIESELEDSKSVVFHFATSAKQCLEMVSARNFDFIFLDIYFSPTQKRGTDILPEIVASHPGTKVCMISGDGSQNTLFKCLARGACDLIVKNGRELFEVTKRIRQFIAQEQAGQLDIDSIKKIASNVGVIFSSKKMDDVFEKIAMARLNPSSHVLITGETGCGKEMIAEAINFQTGRRMVAVDSAAITQDLAESTFFGHTRGSFTGAVSDKIGLFEVAHKGDLFLDELGNLPLSIQNKFLRAIQEKKILPIGRPIPVAADVRIIAATSASFENMIAEGKFRRDLYERINNVFIELPPLRDRREDIPLLIKHFLKLCGKPDLEIADNCMDLLMSHDWVGNIRELSNTVSYLVMSARTEKASIANLPDQFKRRILERNSKDPTTSRVNSENAVFEVPTTGTFDDAINTFSKAYLQLRINQLGYEASQRNLAKTLKLARGTVDSYVERFSLKFRGI